MLERYRAIVGAAALCLVPATKAQNSTVYTVDPHRSKLEINVYREGFLKAFGHDHLVGANHFSGQVQFNEHRVEDSSVTFSVETASLVVVDPGESEKDRNEVQATMVGPKVLDAKNNPEIRFVSTGVRAVRKDAASTELTLDGILRLHGVEKPVTVPLRLHVDKDKLEVEGAVFLLQSDFGIVPVKVAGGGVRVKDRLKIRFTIVAVREPRQ